MNRIEQFLSAGSFAVAGASTDRSKYGNQVLKALAKHSSTVYPINPKADEVEGLKAYPRIDALPRVPESLSIVTPPAVTRQIVQDAIEAGVRCVWMQPGAEDDEAIEAAKQAGMTVICDGECVLVALQERG